MGQVDLAEEKSAGIVVDESACLRAVRGNGASLLFLGVAIDADPEAAADGINFRRGRKRMSQTTYSNSLISPARRWTARAIR